MIQLLFVIIIILLICHNMFRRKLYQPKHTSCVSYFDNTPSAVVAAPVLNTSVDDDYTGGDLNPDSNFHGFLMNTGLDPSVIKSHNQYTADLQTSTTGASTETVFSHSDDIVPYWGLRRHSDYIPIDNTSREVPSQTNAQLQANSGPMKYGLF
jgi:hypothetical protein